MNTSWPTDGTESGQALGTVVRSKWEKGWPFGTLRYSRDRLLLRGFLLRKEVQREDVRVIDVEVVRGPFIWQTLLWLDGVEPQIAFVPYRTNAVIRDLERLGWPVVRRPRRRKGKVLDRSDPGRDGV